MTEVAAPPEETGEVVRGVGFATPRIVSVGTAYPKFVLARFDTDELRLYDLSDELKLPAFEPLASFEEFILLRIVEGGIGAEWDCGADISADSVYYGGTGVEYFDYLRDFELIPSEEEVKGTKLIREVRRTLGLDWKVARSADSKRKPWFLAKLREWFGDLGDGPDDD